MVSAQKQSAATAWLRARLTDMRLLYAAITRDDIRSDMLPDGPEEAEDDYAAFKAAVKNAARKFEHLEVRVDVWSDGDDGDDSDDDGCEHFLKLMVIMKATLPTGGLEVDATVSCFEWDIDSGWEGGDVLGLKLHSPALDVDHLFMEFDAGQLAWRSMRPARVCGVRDRRGTVADEYDILRLIRACLNRECADAIKKIIN